MIVGFELLPTSTPAERAGRRRSCASSTWRRSAGQAAWRTIVARMEKVRRATQPPGGRRALAPGLRPAAIRFRPIADY